MTLLRAIPFSLAILWRMILVFPFLILAIIMFGIIAMFVMFIVALFSPLLMAVMAVSFGVAASVLPVIVGARLGLQAKEASVKNSYLGLILPAIGYGLFEVFCFLLIIAACAAVYFVATPLSFADLGQFAQMDETVLLEQLMAVSPAITLSLLWVGGVLIIGLRAALLMPFAGASIGADPGGRAHTPFYGFGSGFLSMLILVAISYILSAFAVPITMAISFLLGHGETIMAALAQLEQAPGQNIFSLLGVEIAVFVGILFVIYIWVFSLQSAGGVILYMTEAEERADQQSAFDMSMDQHLETLSAGTPQPAQSIQSQDVMELIRSRMQQNKK